jgi:hypothetical protein
MTTKQPSWKIGALMACLGLTASHMGLANPPAVGPRPAAVRDVALDAGGVLHGAVLDRAGRAMAGAPVQVVRDNAVFASVRTDAQGRFAAANLAGGVYQVTTPDSAAVYRLWTPGAAPPSAASSALLLPEGGVVRGQAGMGGALAPVVSAAVIATAAGITVGIAASDDCPPAS